MAKKPDDLEPDLEKATPDPKEDDAQKDLLKAKEEELKTLQAKVKEGEIPPVSESTMAALLEEIRGLRQEVKTHAERGVGAPPSETELSKFLPW